MPIRRALVALVLATLPIFPLAGGAPVAGAQEAGAGIVDEESYASPRYGYEVTWEAPWAADPSQTRSGVGASSSDLLTLGARGGNSAVRIEGFVDESGIDDPLGDLAYVEALIDAIAAALDTTCVAPACEATVIASAPGASPPTLTYDLAAGEVVIRAITALASAETDAGRIVFAETLLTLPDDVEAALEEVQASVTVAGRPALAGVTLSAAASGGGTPVGSPVASPTAGRVLGGATSSGAAAGFAASAYLRFVGSGSAAGR